VPEEPPCSLTIVKKIYKRRDVCEEGEQVEFWELKFEV